MHLLCRVKPQLGSNNSEIERTHTHTLPRSKRTRKNLRQIERLFSSFRRSLNQIIASITISPRTPIILLHSHGFNDIHDIPPSVSQFTIAFETFAPQSASHQHSHCGKAGVPPGVWQYPPGRVMIPHAATTIRHNKNTLLQN